VIVLVLRFGGRFAVFLRNVSLGFKILTGPSLEERYA
jgi:hypothetical protein